MKKFKQQSLKYVAVAVSALLAAACILLATGAYNIIYKLEGTKDIYALDADSLPGSYCYGEVYLIYNGISQVVDSRGNIIYKEYVMPMGEEEFMVLSLPKEYIPAAERLMEESKAFLTGETATEPESVFYVSGKVVEMEKELLRVYKDYFNYDSLEESKKQLCLPYVWTVGRMGSVSNEYVYVGGIFSVVLTAAAAVIFIKWLCGGYQKEITKAKYKNAVNSVVSKTLPVRGRAYMTADFMLFQEGAKTRLVRAEEIEGAAADRDVFGPYLLIKKKRGARKMHTPDAEFFSALVQKTYKTEKKAAKQNEYKSILDR